VISPNTRPRESSPTPSRPKVLRTKVSGVFPADQETFDLLDYTVANVWWITIDENLFTYNLRRVNTDRLFSVTFDLKKPIEKQPEPWGWKE
jgi:hypothetical protein